MNPPTPHRTRRVVSGLLVALFVLLLPITAASAWAHRTVLDTDTYVSTVAPIARDEAVIAAVSRDVTNQLYEALDPQAVIADSLPPKAAFLAGPIATAAKAQVQEAVNRVLSSERFQQLWEEANRFAHKELVTVLRGDSSVLQTTQGQVVLNLVPLLNAALQNATALVSGVVGRAVTLPVIGRDEAPSAACAKISAALDRELPSTCGQIALFPSDDLEAAQSFVRAYDRAVVALLVLVPLLVIGALWASPRRRRTVLQLAVGAVAGLVVARRLFIWEQARLIDSGRPGNEDARRSIVHGLLGGFFDLTVWLLVAGVVVAVIALLTGPYGWAVATRARSVAVGRTTVSLAELAFGRRATAGPDPDSLTWVRRHVDVLRVGGVAVAVVLLLAFDVNIWGFLVIGVFLALFELGLHRLPPAVITLPSSVPRQPSAVDS
jgi:hypothetical protein